MNEAKKPSGISRDSGTCAVKCKENLQPHVFRNSERWNISLRDFSKKRDQTLAGKHAG